MRSEPGRLCRIASLGLLMVAASGCGLLGNKPDLNKLLNYNPQAVGCMNDIGPHVKAYYQGTMDNDTWAATWDCATSNLVLFKKFVHASDDRGFTRDDIHAFVSSFLITNQNVTPELVGAMFELKASLFGGSRDIISPPEFDAIINFLGVLKTETTKLLPFMATRVSDPTPANLLALTDELLTIGDDISAALKTQGNPIFSFSSAQTFVEQLVQILHVDMPPDLVAWLSAVKVVLTAGSADGIASGDWPRIIRAIVSYGGPALAVFSVDSKYLTGPNAIGQFGMQLAWKLKTSLLQTLDLYGGALPLTALDSVIDALPMNWVNIDHTAIKNALRPVANKVLMSHVPNAIDGAAIDLIFEKLNDWNQEQTHLETIFQNLNPGANGVSFEAFNEAASRYLDGLPTGDAPAVYRLISLARQTRPLFLGDDNQMTFTANTTYSLHDLSTFNWITMVAHHLIKAYGSVPGVEVGTQKDLETIISDFTEIARALKAADLSVPGWADARFLEGNLFTYASNGDAYLDADEVTYLIAMAYSAGTLAARIGAGTDAVCPSIGQDVLGQNWKTAACVRRELFTNYRSYWDHEPLLVQYYGRLSPSDQALLQQAMEKSGRRYGVSEQPIASSDQVGFAGITQYVEALLSRFDVNNDQKMDKSEGDVAYPVFKTPLTQLGGLSGDPDWLIKDIFTYVLKYGHPPTKDVAGIASLIGWIIIQPVSSIDADRLKLYEVIASIVQPQPLPGASPTPGLKPQSDKSYTEIANELGMSLMTGVPPAALMQIPMPMASGM